LRVLHHLRLLHNSFAHALKVLECLLQVNTELVVHVVLEPSIVHPSFDLDCSGLADCAGDLALLHWTALRFLDIFNFEDFIGRFVLCAVDLLLSDRRWQARQSLRRLLAQIHLDQRGLAAKDAVHIRPFGAGV